MRTWARYAYTTLLSTCLAFSIGAFYLLHLKQEKSEISYSRAPRAIPVTMGKSVAAQDPFRALRGEALAEETIRLKNEEARLIRRLRGERIEELIDLSKPPPSKLPPLKKPGTPSERNVGGVREVVLKSDFDNLDASASELEQNKPSNNQAVKEDLEHVRRRIYSEERLAKSDADSLPEVDDSSESNGLKSRPQAEQTEAIIAVDRATLWTGPGRSNSMIATARRYTRLTVETRSSDWYRVRLANGMRAWLESKSVEFASTNDLRSSLAIKIGGYSN